MRTTPFQSLTRADAVADAILVRRLTNAGLSLIAPWLVVLVLSGWDSRFIPSNWIFGAAIVVSACTLGFATWTVVFGDRKAWRRAFEQANESNVPL